MTVTRLHGISLLSLHHPQNTMSFSTSEDFHGDSDGKESTYKAEGRGPRFYAWVEKIPWRRKLQPPPVFLPREFHKQRSLVGYGPWCRKELDTTEQLTLVLFSTTDLV